MTDTTAADSDIQTTETTTEAAEPKVITDDIPELDFNGASFRSVQQEPNRYHFYTEAIEYLTAE